MIRRALYPGTFDPISLGHVNIVEKASRLFDEVIVGIASYTGKQTLFDLQERIALVRESCAHIPNIRVIGFEGLSVDFASSQNCTVMIRGMRAVSDFEYELSLALTNKKLNQEIETVFLVPSLKYMYLSSSMIRQLSELDAKLQDFVPACVVNALAEKHALKSIGK